MPNIINPNCPSLPQQVEKNTQDILKLFASNLEELSGLEFTPTSLIYQQDKAIISGKFIVTRDEISTEINGVVSLPIKGENGVVVDASEDNSKIRIALDQSDRELFDFVQELVNRTTESDEIVFTSDMENFVSEALSNTLSYELIFDATSDNIEINKGFTAGVDNNQSIQHDFSKFDFVLGFAQYNSAGAVNEVDGYGQILVDLNLIYNGKYCSRNVPYYFNPGSGVYGVSIKGTINLEKNLFTYNGYYSSSIGDYKNSPIGKLIKLVGVKING